MDHLLRKLSASLLLREVFHWLLLFIFMSSISLVNEGDNSELEEGASKIPFAVCDRSLRRGERGENKIACFQDGWPLLFISLTPFPIFKATVDFDLG